MGRNKEPEQPVSNPVEAKKHRDESIGHFKNGYYERALTSLNKAIELAPEEKAAYVARSRCYLLLGEPRAALTDAETALKLDPKHAKALLQKAEALYYCGEFEMSLVHYHRGLRARPDLSEFRLGVQKAQEAIENTIGDVKPVKRPPPKRRSSSKSQRPVLGQLMSDKLYLENLLKNPDLAIADKKNDVVTKQAEEAIRFLENREEFWRQQQTC
ncbi:outer dynein arm-docking complex subunit 4-like isoform X2 [Ostrinia nubilalis]|uniref:outer dynein arm-docking complex subunit 4-like isoform X2 n=1 Tax=Ostrinia nubilalis TaxID=29057 RepID=UPI0030823236